MLARWPLLGITAWVRRFEQIIGAVGSRVPCRLKPSTLKHVLRDAENKVKPMLALARFYRTRACTLFVGYTLCYTIYTRRHVLNTANEYYPNQSIQYRTYRVTLVVVKVLECFWCARYSTSGGNFPRGTSSVMRTAQESMAKAVKSTLYQPCSSE